MSSLILYPGVLWKSVIKGVAAFLVLLAIYFLVLTLISGWKFTWKQFTQFWYYILSLALGFGVQFGLYSYLRGLLKKQASTGQVLTTTGATSSAAMISCCAHYLVNILPILGVTGIITFISQYQVQFFWVGLFFNLLGIIYIGNKVLKITGLTINKAAIIYSSLMVVILGVVFFNSVSINIGATSNTAAVPGATQESNEGPVSVTVTPQSFGSSAPTWNFEVGLNTHSEELRADLVAVSELVDDQGNLYKPVAWEGDNSGGHHRKGVLKFNPISPKPKSVELRVKNIGGVEQRSFKWDL